MAGLGELDEAEDAGERARGADRARGGGDGGGLERDGRESVDDVGRPCSVGHGEFCAGRARCMPLSAPIQLWKIEWNIPLPPTVSVCPLKD